MREKLISILNRTRYSAHIIRAIVGAYVAYTCGSVVVGCFRTDEGSLLMMLGAGVIALCGAAITLLAGWAIAKGYSVEYKGKAPWTIPEDDEEEAEQLPEESEADEESESVEPAEESEKNNSK